MGTERSCIRRIAWPARPALLLAGRRGITPPLRLLAEIARLSRPPQQLVLLSRSSQLLATLLLTRSALEVLLPEIAALDHPLPPDIVCAKQLADKAAVARRLLR